MDTEQLYYGDPSLGRFAARVIARRMIAGKPAVALDRTAFYPTGGGQPNDTGTLNDVAVSDVISEDDAIWHVLANALPSEEVTGVLNWPRRFDHMQQHTGQHILSEAFIKTHQAETVAFHMGAAACTIDLNRANLSSAALADTETAANAVIDAALPVTTTFLTATEVASLPLRRPPKVTGQIRVVEVAGYDWSACGGTHVSTTAQVGLIKIVGMERRGPETRITFLCGGRARADYARLQTMVEALTGRFTVGQQELMEAVDRLSNEHKAARKELADLEGAWVESTAAALLAGAEVRGGLHVIATSVEQPVERVKRLAQTLRTHAGAVVFLGARGNRPQLIFTRADGIALNAGELLRTAVTVAGGRGGGRPDWAQGGTPTNADLDNALAAAVAALVV